MIKSTVLDQSDFNSGSGILAISFNNHPRFVFNSDSKFVVQISVGKSKDHVKYISDEIRKIYLAHLHNNSFSKLSNKEKLKRSASELVPNSLYNKMK